MVFRCSTASALNTPKVLRQFGLKLIIRWTEFASQRSKMHWFLLTRLPVK